MNIANCIDRNKLFFPDKIALINYEKSWTNKEIWEVTNKIANGLNKLGISKGDKVSIFTTNIPEFIFSFWGILKLGAVAVSISAFAFLGLYL